MNNNAALGMFIGKGDTSRIKQGLTRDFAKTIYDNMPALRTAQITGRGGELEINENGTKTMKINKIKAHIAFGGVSLIV
jgi:hypothetical protein